MGLSSWDFKEYENEVFDDELIKESLELLQKRHDKMADWIEENRPIEECYCGSSNIEYFHNGAKCKDCGWSEDIKVPYPVNGGVVASRKLESIIKELFSLRMAEQRKNEKPSEDQLEKLPFSVEAFDTGEYTKSEVNFLKKRFEGLVDENNIVNQVDMFYIRSLVTQELKIMKMERRDASGDTVKSQDMKRQYEIYNKLATKVKANKSSRDDSSQQDFLSEMEDKLEDTNTEEILEKYSENLEKRKEYKKKAKERKEEVGNPY